MLLNRLHLSSSVSNNSSSNYDNADVVYVLHFTPFSVRDSAGWCSDNIPDFYLGGDLKVQHDCVAFL
jgi:hypothetical protein